MIRQAQLELQEKQKKDAENIRNFDGFVYVQCVAISENPQTKLRGAGIYIYYTREEADPRFPVVLMKVGGYDFVPLEEHKN